MREQYVQIGSNLGGALFFHSNANARARLVPKNFHLEICVFSFGYVYGVLNVVKQQN